MGIKIVLNAEQTIRFKACFIENAKRIILERKLAEKLKEKSKS